MFNIFLNFLNFFHSLHSLLDFIFPYDQHVAKWLSMSDHERLAFFRQPTWREDLPWIFYGGAYKDDILKEVIHEVKYYGNRRVAKTMWPILDFLLESLLQEVLSQENLSQKLTHTGREKDLTVQPSRPNRPNIVILPIPRSKKREREYGFTQTFLYIDKQKYICNISADPDKSDSGLNISCVFDLLINSKRSSQLKNSSISGRKNSVENVFTLGPWPTARAKSTENRRVDDQTIYIIFDDVTTSGATLEAVRQCLVSAGADPAKVFGLAVVR